MNAHAHSDSSAHDDFSPCAGARADSARLADLHRREHVAMAAFLVALADFDLRRRWRDLGHASLFAYLHVELGVSKGAAHYRKVAVGLVQRFPEVVEPLRDGRVCITSVVELARVLTPENRGQVLPRFFHRSRREAQALAAAIRPDEAPPRRDVVTAVRHLAAARLEGDAAGAGAAARLPAAGSRPVQPAELGATSPSGEGTSSTAAHPEPFDSSSLARGCAQDRLRAEGPHSRESPAPRPTSIQPQTALRSSAVPSPPTSTGCTSRSPAASSTSWRRPGPRSPTRTQAPTRSGSRRRGSTSCCSAPIGGAGS